MGWDLEWGNKLEFLETLKQQGQEPEALKNRPRLRPWLVDYYGAFKVVSASRALGMGAVGPVPLSEMKAYFEIFEIRDLDERETYIKMIQALDSVYLKHTNKPAEAELNKPPPKRHR